MGHCSDCSVCKKEVKAKDKGVACIRCDDWYHIKCIGLTDAIYKGLAKDNLLWSCNDCLGTVKDLICKSDTNDNVKSKPKAEHYNIPILVSKVTKDKNNRNWIKPKKVAKKNTVIKSNLIEVTNKFEILNESDKLGRGGPNERPNEVRSCGKNKITNKNIEKSKLKVIGDSQVRNLGVELIKDMKNLNPLVTCYPGANINRIDDNVTQSTIGKGDNLLIHVGGNDTDNSKTEALIKNYDKLLETLRYKRLRCEGKLKIFITGIIPRMYKTNMWYSKVIGINNRISKLCQAANIEYIDLWENYFGKSYLYNRDGIHLNKEGTRCLANIISNVVQKSDNKTRNGEIKQN